MEVATTQMIFLVNEDDDSFLIFFLTFKKENVLVLNVDAYHILGLVLGSYKF